MPSDRRLHAEDLVAKDLAEVWGDIVSLRHLLIAVTLGAAISLATYFAAVEVLHRLVADPAIAKAWAMLGGLAGCLTGGALCARLLPPKRILSDDAPAASDQAEAARLLLAEARPGDRPAHGAVVAELAVLGLTDPVAGKETGR